MTEMNDRRSNLPASSVRKQVSTLAIIVALTLVAGAAFASTPQGTFDKTFQVSGAVNLEVLTRSGDVSVHRGPAGSVSIRGKIFVGDHWLLGDRRGDVSEIEQHPPLRQDGNSIHVDYVNDHNISVDYEITVPEETAIRIHSGSGGLTIDGTRGNADLQSGSGDLKLSHMAGEIRLQTGSGNVRAQELAGAVRGGTGSGDIELQETGAGDIDLRAGSGNITARGIHGAFRADTGSGDVTAEGTQTGSWEVRAGSGNVRLRLPADAAFDANLSTSSGTIQVAPAITMTVQGRIQESRKEIVGKVHGGGPLVKVRTGSGDIQIE
jgi:DUF4097 and DUF4098 domain-containing protein YvlB